MAAQEGWKRRGTIRLRKNATLIDLCTTSDIAGHRHRGRCAIQHLRPARAFQHRTWPPFSRYKIQVLNITVTHPRRNWWHSGKLLSWHSRWQKLGLVSKLERKSSKLSIITFTYRSPSYFFYGSISMAASLRPLERMGFM
jgi:hypothetical protein